MVGETTMSPKRVRSFGFPIAAVLSLAVWGGAARAVDCNNNGIEDATDIGNGTSEDCQPDGVPDECGTPIGCLELERTILTPSDVASGDEFGWSVAISGNRAVVSARASDTASAGAAYVFAFNGTDWVEEAKLLPSGAAAGSVAIEGNVIALTGSDAVRVFRFDGSDWNQEAELTPTGWVAMSGNVLLVGNTSIDCEAGENCGAAYVFRYDGAAWIQEAELTASDQGEFDYFGTSVALDGNRAVVGAVLTLCPSILASCGAAYVFEFDGVEWQEIAKLAASNGQGNDYFGTSVAIDQNRIVVGAQFANGVNCNHVNQCGAAYVFDFDGFAWLETILPPSGEAPWAENFGRSVAIEDDNIVVGAPGTLYLGPGVIYWYRFDGASWIVTGILGHTEHPYGQFGASLSLDSGTMVAGAFASGCCGDAFVAPLVTLDDDCNCNAVADLCEVFDFDCNLNALPDDCDISAGTSVDCNGNGVPDECVPTEVDCNENFVPDDCDIAGGTPDVNANGIPDECDFEFHFGDDTCHTAAQNMGTPCGTDADCLTGQTCGLKSRYVSFEAPSDGIWSVRVTILSMPQFPQRVGEVWWAGPEAEIPDSPNPSLRGSRLRCTFNPNSQVWTPGTLHLFGSAVVPNATYELRLCDSAGTNCSDPYIVATGRWGDIMKPFGGASQPNFADVSSVVDKFRNLAAAPAMPRSDLLGSGNLGQPNVPNQVASFADVSNDVEAFRGAAFPFTVPACP